MCESRMEYHGEAILCWPIKLIGELKGIQSVQRMGFSEVREGSWETPFCDDEGKCDRIKAIECC